MCERLHALGRRTDERLAVQTRRGTGYVVVRADALRRDQRRGEGRNQGSEPRDTFALTPVPRVPCAIEPRRILGSSSDGHKRFALVRGRKAVEH